jgi:hypothetical protein
MRAKSKNLLLATCLLMTSLLASSVPAFGHHSEVAYDEDTLITLKGTVTQFEFINPHVIIHLEAKDDKGNLESWLCFSAAPGVVSRAGWTYDYFKPGEELTVMGFAEKSGRKVMLGVRHVRANGHEVPEAWQEKQIYKGYLDRRAKEQNK